MRKLAMGIVVIVAICMMFVPTVFAQQAPGGGTYKTGAWNIGVPGTFGETGFTGNEAIVVESGKVVAMEKMAGVKDGWQMKFKSGAGNAYTVVMGPKWFIENQKIKFAPGDNVVVRGKKFNQYIVATQVSKGDWTMKLRNEEDGQPSWECCFPGAVKMQ